MELTERTHTLCSLIEQLLEADLGHRFTDIEWGAGSKSKKKKIKKSARFDVEMNDVPHGPKKTVKKSARFGGLDIFDSPKTPKAKKGGHKTNKLKINAKLKAVAKKIQVRPHSNSKDMVVLKLRGTGAKQQQGMSALLTALGIQGDITVGTAKTMAMVPKASWKAVQKYLK